MYTYSIISVKKFSWTVDQKRLVYIISKIIQKGIQNVENAYLALKTPSLGALDPCLFGLTLFACPFCELLCQCLYCFQYFQVQKYCLMYHYKLKSLQNSTFS